MTNNFNTKPHFPFTYGDENADEVKLSNYVVDLMKTKKFQNYVTAVFFALMTLGSYAQPSSAIPPEYGEAANNVVHGMDQAVPPLGAAAGVANVGANAAQGNPVPNQLGQIGQAGRVNLNNPPIQPNQQFQAVKVPAWRLPPAPVTPVGQYANTVVLIASVGWICLNGAWGNPIFMGGCIGIFTGLANEARKIIFK